MSLTLLRGALGAVLLALLGTAQAERREVMLEQSAMAATEQGRADLKYLSYCALDHETTLVAEHGGQRWQFPGQVGLAPRWHEQTLSLPQQQELSACMLALANHAGAQVQVSLYFPTPPLAAVRSGWLTMDRQHQVPEGRFFGNLFADPPLAYVCSERFDAAKTAWLRQRPRLCALPGKETDDQGRRRTVCDMLHVGRCEATGAFTQNGVTYGFSVQVFLPADGKPAR